MTQYPGVYRAVVLGNASPQLLVQVPQLFGVATISARSCLPPGWTGTLPALGSQVWVGFEGGEARFPVWLGEVNATAQGVPNEGFVLTAGGSTILVPVGADGLDIRFTATSTGQALQVFDHLGSPIFVIPAAGGPAVLGDNFRVFAGGEVFNHIIKLRVDGTIQLAQGDAAGGAGVLAIGTAASPPTAKPDGTNPMDGSVTHPGAVLWSDSSGRLFAMRRNGLVDSVTGARPAGSVNTSAVGDWLTPPASLQGTYAMSVADVNRMFLSPIDVTSTSAVYNTVGALCSVAGAGATYQQFRLGIYQDDGSLTRPLLALQIADFGIASGGYTNLQTTAATATLSPTWSFPNAGRFWIGAVFQASGSPTPYPTVTTAQTGLLASGADLSTATHGWYVSGVTGLLPTTGTLVPSVAPYVGLRRSA